MEDVPFGPPPRVFNYHCSECDAKFEVNEAIVDTAYGWTKKRTKTSDGEEVPVLECYKCRKIILKCID